jgi:hypothetical protein
MLITILEMTSPFLKSNLKFFASGSYLVGNAALVQAHTKLDKAAGSFMERYGLNWN